MIVLSVIEAGEGLGGTSMAERYMLIYMINVLAIIVVLFIAFFVMFNIRKNKLLQDKIKREQEFETQIAIAKAETQEQILKDIAWELHDSVGQLLIFGNMQAGGLLRLCPETLENKVLEIHETLKSSLTEVRALSKTLNGDVVLDLGFEKSISNELLRLERMRFDKATLQVIGNQQQFIRSKDEVMLFRIIQEFLSNSVKYSLAKTINISMDYQSDFLIVIAKDDGQGFDMDTVEKGSGLININSRAKLINAELTLNSAPGEGVELIIRYPLSKAKHEDALV
ncbi:sensor histidine kinase [Pseudotamlana carrageenivorans]|uniref:histidine kinase n=1 Tax=Pseudotamlana carrageenivorans TaxID=2069432 RepID=A0A2I7SKC8_9FLAO|nr:histidine kinase [Tamlana carrageenivorans]AUS06366.1 histidine kinase [Tamlana carrageenivorans]